MYANITFRLRFDRNFHNRIFIYAIFWRYFAHQSLADVICKILLSLQVESILNYGQVQEDQQQNMSRILTNISNSSTMTSNQTHQVVQHGALGKLVKLFYLFNLYVAPYVCKKSELSLCRYVEPNSLKWIVKYIFAFLNLLLIKSVGDVLESILNRRHAISAK